VSLRAFRVACLVWMLLAFPGCSHAPPPPKGVTVIDLDPELASGARKWAKALEQRFDPPYSVVSAHGLADASGELWMYPPKGPRVHAQSYAAAVMRLRPGPCFLLTCNQAGVPLEMKGVWYSRKVLASTPWCGDPKKWATTPWDLIEGGPTTRPTTRPEGPLPPATRPAVPLYRKAIN
jgi:hypothetical protein